MYSDNFDDNSIGTAWTSKNGTWTESGQVMSQISTAAADPKKVILSNSGVDFGSNHTIKAKVKVNTWTNGDHARAGVSLFSNAANGAGYNLLFHNDHSTVQFLNDVIGWSPSFSFSWSTGVWYWFKLKMENGTLYGKVWQDGSSEPSGWTYSWAPGGTLRTGYPALNGSSALTGSATVSFDDVSVTTN